MTRWSRVTALFEGALELDPEAREELLARAAQSDAETAHEVRILLETHFRAGTFLEAPAWAADPGLLSEAVDPPQYEIGRQLGPYRLKEEIGRGGMGVVYAAEDTRLGRTVALKALPPSFTREPSARERLTREARAAAALTHPAIATIYALEEIDGELFIASELIRGLTLRTELADGPLPHGRLEPTLLEIAAGLDAAHRKGIVHRDLKPENVMRTADGHLKIVDFGLARATAPSSSANARLTRTGSLLGTPGYMAPEQLRGETLDARADVFAFGVMACELATGAHPFGGNDPAALVERMVSDALIVSTHLTTSGLDAVVRRCLQGSRENRYANGGELSAALRAAIAGAPAAPSAAAKMTLWWWQFHQVAVALLCGAVLIPMWLSRPWNSWGSAAFLATLVLVTISTALRLHLWFVSHVHQSGFPIQRARLLPWIVAIEALLVVLLTAVAIALSGRHDPVAAWFVVTALLLVVSIVVIEPATTRAALA